MKKLLSLSPPPRSPYSQTNSENATFSEIVQFAKSMESIDTFEDGKNTIPQTSEEIKEALLLFAKAMSVYIENHPEHCELMWTLLSGVFNTLKMQHPMDNEKKGGPKQSQFPSPPSASDKDDFNWLENKNEAMQYILDENKYTSMCMKPVSGLITKLYNEFVSRHDESETSAHIAVPSSSPLGAEWTHYFSRKVPGSEYRQHCRLNKNGSEHIYLDENELSKTEYFRLGFLRHSPCGRFIAFGVDENGSERYTVRFKNLCLNIFLDFELKDCGDQVEFSKCGNFFYYVQMDNAERPYRISRYEFQKTPETLFEETDQLYYVCLTKSCSSEHIFVKSVSINSSETRALFLPEKEFKVIIPRSMDHMYSVESNGKYFYVLSNLKTPHSNWIFRMLQCDFNQKETVLEARDFVLIEEIIMRVNHLIVFERSNCIQNVRIIDLRDDKLLTFHYIAFSDIVYSLNPMSVWEEIADISKHCFYDSSILRYTYTSFTQPKQIIDYNLETRQFQVVYTDNVCPALGYEFSSDLYESKREFAISDDGTVVPISMVYRKDIRRPAFTLLTGYGAYGSSFNPLFCKQRLSLLDRGFIFAIAHIRGGSEMGKRWYDEGKQEKKPNVFKDFIKCMQHLISEEYTCPEKLSIYGRSAGGLTAGVAINEASKLCRSALLEVPFVDVYNTMMKKETPWTCYEYYELGNPKDENIRNLMKSYCPFINIRENEFPHILVCSGINDPRVRFSESTKYVAKIRKYKKDDNLLLLRMNEYGHFGSGGLYTHLRDVAEEYAFLIYTLQAPFESYHETKPHKICDLILPVDRMDSLIQWAQSDF